MNQQVPGVPLRRELGLIEVTLSGVGIILGAGVYVLIGQAAGLCGNAVWLAFFLAAVMALLTGLSYAELSSLFPRAGAEYDYVKNAFNAQAAFVTGWLVFLSGILAASTVALGFGGYFEALTGVPVLVSALLLLLALTVVLALGIRETVRVAVVSAIIEAAGLVIIIAIGLPRLGTVSYGDLPQGFMGLFAATGLIFFAFQGFESMVKFSEETKNPESTVPKALILALIISLVLYILVALSAVSVAGWQALAGLRCAVYRYRVGHAGPGMGGDHQHHCPLCYGKYGADVPVCLDPSSFRNDRVLITAGRSCMGPPTKADPVGRDSCLRGPVSHPDIRR